MSFEEKVSPEMNSQPQFEHEALPHVEALFRFAVQLCKDPQNSRDLVQDTLMKACRSFDTYRKGSNCRAWLFQICKNTYINGYRRKQLEPTAIDVSDEVFDSRNGSATDRMQKTCLPLRDDVDLLTHEAIMGDEVLGALRELPHDYQTAVILSDIEGQPYEEIAEFMQVPVGTIRSRIHRGRRLLAVELAAYARLRGWNGAAAARA